MKNCVKVWYEHLIGQVLLSSVCKNARSMKMGKGQMFSTKSILFYRLICGKEGAQVGQGALEHRNYSENFSCLG